MREECLAADFSLTRPVITVVTSARLIAQTFVLQHGISFAKSENIPNKKLSTGSEIVWDSSSARWAAFREITYADVPIGEEHSVLIRELLSCSFISS